MDDAWYAVAVSPRREVAAAADIQRAFNAQDTGPPGTASGRVFLPVRRERRPWTDRIKEVEVPLFPGYLFVRLVLTPTSRVQLLRCAGVVDVVGRRAGATPLAPTIPDAEVASLQRLVAAARSLDPVASLVPGVVVEVGAGALKGVRGVVEEAADGQRRLVVQVSLLGRGVRTVLAADDVLVAPDRPNP